MTEFCSSILLIFHLILKFSTFLHGPICIYAVGSFFIGSTSGKNLIKIQKITHWECNIYHSVSTAWLLNFVHHPSFPKHTCTKSNHSISETEFCWILVFQCGQAFTQMVLLLLFTIKGQSMSVQLSQYMHLISVFFDTQ